MGGCRDNSGCEPFGAIIIAVGRYMRFKGA